MKKGFGVASIFVGIILAVFLFGSFPAHAQKVVKLRYSNFFPPVHPISKLSEEWCKEVEKRTSGRVKFTYFAGGHPYSSHADL